MDTSSLPSLAPPLRLLRSYVLGFLFVLAGTLGCREVSPPFASSTVQPLSQGFVYLDPTKGAVFVDASLVPKKLLSSSLVHMVPLNDREHVLLQTASLGLILAHPSSGALVELKGWGEHPLSAGWLDNQLWVLSQRGQLAFFRAEGSLERMQALDAYAADTLLEAAASVARSPWVLLVKERRLLLWDLKLQREVQSFGVLEGQVQALGVSEQGKFLGVGTDRGEIRVYKMGGAGKRYTQVFAREAGGAAVVQVSVSEQKNQALVITSEGQGLVYNLNGVLCKAVESEEGLLGAVFGNQGQEVWGADRKRQGVKYDVGQECYAVRHTLTGHRGPVYHSSISPDGTQVVTASADRTAKIWNAKTGALQYDLVGHTATVYRVAFSPDGTQVVTGSGDATVKIWNAKTGALEHTLTGHTGLVNRIAFSPDGTQVVTVSPPEVLVKIWNAKTGKLERNLLDHLSRVNNAQFSPDGMQVVTASADNTVKIWNAKTGVLETTLGGHTNWVFDAKFSPDGTQVVTASHDKTAKIWNAKTGVLEHTLVGHIDNIRYTEFSPDGTQVVTASIDGTTKIWNAKTGALEHTLPRNAVDVEEAVFSPDGMQVVTASFDKTTNIWNAKTGVLEHTLVGNINGIFAAKFFPDGMQVITAHADNTVKIWSRQGSLVGTAPLFPEKP